MDWDNYKPERHYFQKPQDTTGVAIKIGIAVFVAITAAWAIREAYLYWMLKQFAEAAQRSAAQISERSQQQLLMLQHQQQQRMAAEALRNRQDAEARAEMQRRDLESMENAARERQRKEVAWEKFYKKRIECENPVSNLVFVECTNEYMRAKQRFEREWKSKIVTTSNL
jgi:aspartate/methionine/tyrosine aminotransferase